MEINKIMHDYLELLDKPSDKSTNPWNLSIELEDFVSPEMYDFIKAKNPNLLRLIADDIYDITEPMEPDMDSSDFYKKLEEFKLKVLDTIK